MNKRAKKKREKGEIGKEKKEKKETGIGAERKLQWKKEVILQKNWKKGP